MFSVQDILEITGGSVVNQSELGSRLDEICVKRPAPLTGSGASELSFFFAKSYASELPQANPGVLITGPTFVTALKDSGLPLWKTSAVIACADPHLSMAVLSEKFVEKLSLLPKVDETSVHPSAVLHPTVKLGANVLIGPHTAFGPGVVIGDRVIVHAGCTVGSGSSIGSDSILYPRVSIYEDVTIGARVRIHAGAVIGSDGFGYAPVRDLESPGRVLGHRKIYHLGRVVIGDDVEIGANSCVDRATFGETKIESQVKLDNLVHIGHNAHVEEGAVICGGTCLAGRAHIGRFVTIGGLTGIANDIHVGDGAQVGALSLVTKDVERGGTALGNPQRDYREHFKAHAKLNRLLVKESVGRNKND